MKFIFIFLFIFQTAACEIGKDSTCGTNKHCVFIQENEPAKCVDDYSGKIPEILFPFEHTNPVKCWKSNGKMENSSHAWSNALYAIDLHSDENRLGIIKAGLSGRVISFTGCNPNDAPCNSAFGNQVKIFTDNGIMLFYVHLNEVFVKTGDFVTEGQIIGREGLTGNVGDMWGETNDFHHLHLSVHYDWRKFNPAYHNNSWPGLDSIPFKLKIANNKIIDIRDIKCSKFSDNPETLIGPNL